MNASELLIQRMRILAEGALGLLSWEGKPIALTLERTYADGDRGTHTLKIAAGAYRLVRTWYNRGAYATWQILGGDITADRRILIHRGNLETDSDGCILVGSGLLQTPGRFGIAYSAEAFGRLMSETAGHDQLALTVINC